MIRVRRLALATAILGIAAAEAGEVSGRKMVWAHYVPWNVPDNVSLTTAKYYNYPCYDRTAEPRRDEVRRALALGVDGFFMDVVVAKGHTAFFDLRPFLLAAEGTDFQVGICLDRKTTIENHATEIAKMLDLYGDHPNYPHFQGRPVVITFTFWAWTADEWRGIREAVERKGHKIWLIANIGAGRREFSAEQVSEYAKIFDAGYFFGYNLEARSYGELNRVAKSVCDNKGRFFMPSVSPGYYGAWLNGRNDFYQPYRGLDTIQDKFEGGREAAHTWFHLTTWNDYDETALEPRRLSPGCGALIRAYADETKGLQPSAERADVLFAYHREEFPGTLLRFEAMRLPARERGPVTVEGVLLDKSGTVAAKLAPKRLRSAWERTEWLVPSVEHAKTPHLTPVFRMKRESGDSATVVAEFPSLFLVRPWLQNPETVRVTFADTTSVKGKLEVLRDGSRACARLVFDAETEVRRVVLMRNDRPVGSFEPHDGKDETMLPLVVTGKGSWSLDVEGGRIAAAARLFATNAPGVGPFEWTARRLVSRAQPVWATTGVRLALKADACVILKSGAEKRRMNAQVLVDAGTVKVGSLVFDVQADACLMESRPWSQRKGSAALNVWLPSVGEQDVFWARFECADGRAGATRPIYPFGRDEVRTEPLVETCVTQEGTTNGSGRPGAREFLTSDAELPVRGTRVVDASVSVLGRRCRTFPGGRFDGSGKDRIRLPLRTWPTGPSEISFVLRPAAFPAQTQNVICKNGQMDGVAVNLDKDGFLEIVHFGKDGERVALKAVRALGAETETRVRIVNDGRSLKLWLDGALAGEMAIEPCRQYGNLNVWLGGGAKGLLPYRGEIRALEIGALKQTR